jgi:hypothetical protein
LCSRGGAARFGLSVLAAAGLIVDAYIHFDLAANYDAIKTSTLSQGDLFRAEGVVALLAAIAVVARPRRYTAAIALVVAGSALAALLVYRYDNVSAIGPIPAMYEPVWFTEKTIAAVAEAVATLAAAAAFVAIPSRPWTRPWARASTAGRP